MMLEELLSQELIKKVGGRFKLAALVQRRMTELLQGSRPLIENAENLTMMEIALQEILQDKITIDTATYERRPAETIIERRDDDDDEPRGKHRY
jgi:DNA-directed RNA polymerase subunit omega